MAVQPKRFCLFNCDNTYDLKPVEECLEAVEEKYGFKISVDLLYFRLRQMAEMVETTLPTLKMEFAIFVVHANESRLSINEDNAGIGYARLYKALLRATDDKVLIVIGGDSYYKDEDEEDRFFISRWSRRKVASQFNEEYLDGRKSFIFSWDTKHRPIHEEALRHYLDPSKKGVKFVYARKPKPLPRPAEREFIPSASQDLRQEPFLGEDDGIKLIKNGEEPSTRRGSVSSDRGGQRNWLRGDKEEANYGATDSGASGTSVDHPAGRTREDLRQPSERQGTHLREDYGSTPDAQVRGDSSWNVAPAVPKPDCCTRLKNCLCSCCICLKNCFVACFLGLVHCFRSLWG